MNFLKLFRCTVPGALAAAVAFHCSAADSAEQEKIRTAVDALTRMENVNLEAQPGIKAAVQRVLDRTRGTPAFVRVVQHFKLKDQNAGLLAVAAALPDDESGVAAVRLVLASKDTAAINAALDSTNGVSIARALGGTKEKQAAALLEPLVTDERRPGDVRRAAVRGLAQTQDGAASLLALAKQDKLPENLKFLAASELNAARWPEIKAQAAQLLPLPAGQNAQPLPPFAELVKMKGSAAKGAEVFRRETVGCVKCHVVRGEGRDVGPALSEIGTKLAREALYESILDPSAGISFGFEAWQVTLKSGDEAFGLKASDTPDEVAIKDTNGLVTRHKRADIATMQQTKTSIMPSGLQQTMTTQELVDLIEYLASLKKAGP
jgi:putative heme-binding domain-containing protein